MWGHFSESLCPLASMYSGREPCLRRDRKNLLGSPRSDMQPLRFREIYKEKPWGGTEIGRLKACDLPQGIGESFEISGVPGSETLVADGEFEGQSLSHILQHHGAQLLGRRNAARYGTDFPLLIKFISAADNLSLQVHPDDDMARELGHPFGKNEMWFIVKSDAEAKILNGFSTPFSPEAYTAELAAGRLLEHVNADESHVGDCFYIPAGCIHSIGAGNLLVEIQQSSDDTFRVYDYDRVGADGSKRELHVEMAKRALNYELTGSQRVAYTSAVGSPVTLVESPSFTTRLCRFVAPVALDYTALDSFVIFIAFEGGAQLTDSSGHVVQLVAGSSILFPADNAAVSVQPLGDVPCAFLEVTLP